ncbi:hypothetical protein L3X38_026520 [Prunus dulcis]|uniref:Uncharacterized protein n=1 Tax=Prunus dulcis TaxID=3755 RepID=A0AAD4VMP3_PRUDU|nr:hypothetical protein L3X38_026520 [Prunus dulcis]
MYERKTAQNKASVIRRLVNLKYRDGRSVTEHLSDFQGLINLLTNMKMVLDDELQALVLLSSLPDSWDTLVVSLSNSAPQGVLTLDIVKDSMFNEEARRKEQGVVAESEALVSEYRGRPNNRKFHRRDKSKGRSRDGSRGRSKTRKDLECYHCGGIGHMKRGCRLFKREQDRGNEKSDAGHTTATTSDGNEIVDSGASFHVTSRRDFFTSYTNGDFGNVRMGNDKLSKIVGRGDISLETNTSCHLVLKDVRHVPDMRLNLISTGLLDDEGYTNVFAEGKWKLSKNSLVLARGKKENTLYMAHAKVSNGYVNALAEDSIELWHKRLGHMSKKGLQILAQREALTGMKKCMPLKSCTHCLAGKQHRASFQHGHAQRKPNVLDVVYSDVCGPMTISTLGGARYFVTFIDDHSRKVWAYALRTKDQVYEVFKQFHASVERETSRIFKCIRTDNGGEYMGAFRNYCRSNGIRHERSVPKTPQHNGIAERMNRTIVERIRTMLSHAKLSKSFWGEALMTAIDLINLSPSAPLNGDVPNKLWDPVARKIIRSRDVVFFEDQNIEDIRRGDKPNNPREYPANLDLVPSPLEHNDRRDEFNDTDDPASDPIINEPVDDDMSDDYTTDGIVDDVADEGLEVQADEEPAAELQPRRSTRVRRPSCRYSPDDYVLLTDEGEPECYKEALTHDQQDKWLKAMHEEMQSLHENHTYDLVNLPKGRRALKNKWVYRLKTEENNSKPRFKARLVVKGFSQKKGIDFEEIFSPVVKMSSIRVVLGLAASLNLEIEQLDVKTAFLHGDLEEEIYMEQPEGFKVKGKEDLVCRLKKSLYGLKQAPRQWYKKFDSFMIEHRYRRTTSDHCVFVKRFDDGEFIILLLYVDDMLIVGQNSDKISKLKKELSKSFAMKDLGPAK